MRTRTAILIGVLALGGCQDKKDDPNPKPVSATPPPADPAPANTPPAAAGPAGPVAGAIKGKPFKPDTIRLEGARLEFRAGTGFFPDAEIAFDLPDAGGGLLEGKAWTFDGQFAAPVLSVSARAGQDLPQHDFVFGKDLSLTLRITKQTKKAVEGTIDLKVKTLPNTYLAGAFTADLRKATTAPLDADDVPYVRGRVRFVGDVPEEMVSAGFTGKGADGKAHSNAAGMSIGGKSDGGHVTSTTFAPQLTTLMTSEKGGPEYRHTHVPPGEYLVFVRRGELIVASKRVAVKAGDELTVDLTVDTTAAGELVVTIPEEEAKDTSNWPLTLVPADAPAGASSFDYRAAEVKAGQTTVTVKGVPAGKYRAVRGQSEAAVEVTAGKSAAVTLVRKKA